MNGFKGRAAWNSAAGADRSQADRFFASGGNAYGEASDRETRLAGMFRLVRAQGQALDPSAAAALFLRHWKSGRADALCQIKGHYAVAVWEGEANRLTLVRSPLSPLPLCVRRDGTTVHFGSSAADLIEPANRHISLSVLAGRLTGNSLFHQQSLFPGIETIAPGTALELRPGGRRTIRFWDPVGRPPIARPNAVAAARLRRALDEAVATAMEAFSGPVACHLSAGRDSAAVTASAALYDRSRVVAFTSAPNARYPQYWERFTLDESIEAASMAKALQVEHRIIRDPAPDFCLQMDRLHAVQNVQMGTPVNLPWWEEISRQAASEGCRVLFNGDAGNLTISNGGPRYLRDVWVRSGPLPWWYAFKDARRSPHASISNLLKFSFAPSMPSAAYRLAEWASARRSVRTINPFLSDDLQSRLKEQPEVNDSRPPSDQRAIWQAALRDYDPADRTPEAVHGYVMFDPTADIDVVNAALDLTDEQLASPYHQRKIFDLAFGDRLSAQPDQFGRRGIQSADWNLTIDPADLAGGMRRYRQNPLVERLLAMDEMERALKQWPQDFQPFGPTRIHLANHLLEALSVASFIWVHDPSGLCD